MAGLARILATLGFLALMFTGLGFVAVHLAGPAGGRIATQANLPAVLDGALTGAVDKAVVAALPALEGLQDIVAGLSYRMLGDAGPQVRAGCPGWLFLAEELVETRDGAAHLADRVKLAAKLKAAVEAKGAALVVLPVPDKADLSRATLCGLAVSLQARGRAEVWRRQSAGAGLDQVDIATDWPAGAFLRTDTHWNDDGAAFAAHRVADHVIARLGPGTLPARVVVGVPKDRIGDLMRLAGLARTWPWSGPQPDRQPEVGTAFTRTGGLLDDVPAPTVLLAGSSYSRNSGFLDYLQDALDREVAQKSQDGGGFAGPLLDLLATDPDSLSQTRLVVWEFPMRVLTQPLTAAERNFLGDDR
ncbi:alginate O-acetyltransferase AlgX-related protein [Xanthobacter agilis]|uniref:alginate O-acetyltransferase AlgX-related protein n=1 Tax=Xanthobacter agilis TaxID=47492 RepID=UPI003729BA5C